MGWLLIDSPGIGNGPCKKKCKHLDCADARAEAARSCRICGYPIGYDTKFYWERNEESPKNTIVHFVCMWTEEELRRAWGRVPTHSETVKAMARGK